MSPSIVEFATWQYTLWILALSSHNREDYARSGNLTHEFPRSTSYSLSQIIEFDTIIRLTSRKTIDIIVVAHDIGKDNGATLVYLESRWKARSTIRYSVPN